MSQDNLDDFEDYFVTDEPVVRPATPESEPEPAPSRPVSKPKSQSPASPKKNDDKPHAQVKVVKKKRHRVLKVVLSLIFLSIVSGGLWFYFSYCNPYVAQAEITGYVVNIDKRGHVFNTYEGDVISEFAVNDTSTVYRRDFSFSVTDEAVAAQLINLQGSGKKVTLKYKTYLGVLPWRGNSKNVVVAVESH